MLPHPTLDQLRALRLDGMADAFVELQAQDHARDLAPAEWLAPSPDRQATHRRTQRVKTRAPNAQLPTQQATLDDVRIPTPTGPNPTGPIGESGRRGLLKPSSQL